MITPENYEQLMLEYEVLKNIVIDSGMTAEEFLHELNNKTIIGKKYLAFFDKVTDGKDVCGAVKDFVFAVWNKKIDYK